MHVLGSIFIGNNADGIGTVVVRGEDATGNLSSPGYRRSESRRRGLWQWHFGSARWRVVQGQNIRLGRDSGSIGRALVEGVGAVSGGSSTLVATNDLSVGGTQAGPGGDGELVIRNNGIVNVGNNMFVWGAGSGNKGLLRVDSTYTLNVNNTLVFDGGRLAFIDDTDFVNDVTLGNTQTENGIFVDTNGTTSTMSGLITGAGRLTKRDTGTLILTADNIFTGRTIVEQGTLQIDGAVGGSASVRANGTLTGVYDGVANNVERNLRNRGIVSPGDNPGDPAIFQVGRDFTNHPEGSLFVDVGGLTEGVDADLLRILGGASIEGGTLQATRINGFAPTPGDRVTILRTDLGRTGEFDTVVPLSWGLIQPMADYDDPNTVDLVFDFAASFESQALNRNELCIAEGLDDLISSSNPRAVDLITFLGNVPTEQLPLAFELISPDEYASAYTISFSHATLQNANLQRHLDAVRTSAGGYCPPLGN